jgi:hypothetical protein
MPARSLSSALLAGAFMLAVGHGRAAAQDWEPLGALPTGGQPRQYAAGVNHNGVLYALGGTPWQNGGDQDGSVHRYENGTWTAVAAVGGAGPIISEAAGVDALGRIVVYGGFIMDDDGPGPDRVYDPIEGLTDPIAARPVPDAAIGYFAWAADDQQRLYGFGGGPGAGGPNSAYCDRYDATTDSWAILAAMPTPAADACAAYDGNGHMLVIGGINVTGTTRLANVAQYDIATDTWSDSAVPDLPVAVSGARAVLGADGRVYVIGGETGPLGAGSTQTSVYKLEPAINDWVSAAPLTTPRKWFACVLGDDDYIYAIGGDNDAGGTDTFERLFTPRCAVISGPADQLAYSGSVAGFMVTVSGAEPLTYQWRRDGVDLVDGPTGTGSTISGALTPTLTVAQPGSAEVGAYDVVVTNDCGAVASVSADLTLQDPPALPASWTVTNIHPAWADGTSTAYGVANGRVAGSAIVTTLLPDGRELDLAHPVLWNAVTFAPNDITPPGHIGGAVLDAEDNLLVGWFWHTYSCPPYTCAWQSAGYWYADTLEFTETHMSGAEYDHAVGTDGVRLVTNAAFEYTPGFYTFRPCLWTPPHSVTFLDPGDIVDRATVNAIDGDRQYGSLIPAGTGSVFHAAMWTGTAASIRDVHPAGYIDSTIVGAGDAQAVGRVETGGAQRAALWAGGTAAITELHRAEWTSSESVAASGGVQVGTTSGKAVLWIGAADVYADLDAFAPPEFTSTTAQDVEVAGDGTITVVGYGYNSVSGQQEALVWQSSALLGDCNGDGYVDMTDFTGFVDCLLGPDNGLGATCPCFDFDHQDDVDLADFVVFQQAFTGPQP